MYGEADLNSSCQERHQTGSQNLIESASIDPKQLHHQIILQPIKLNQLGMSHHKLGSAGDNNCREYYGKEHGFKNIENNYCSQELMGLGQTEITTHSSATHQEKLSDNDCFKYLDMRNFSRDSRPNDLVNIDIISSGFLQRGRDKLSSQPAATAAYNSQSLVPPNTHSNMPVQSHDQGSNLSQQPDQIILFQQHPADLIRRKNNKSEHTSYNAYQNDDMKSSYLYEGRSQKPFQNVSPSQNSEKTLKPTYQHEQLETPQILNKNLNSQGQSFRKLRGLSENSRPPASTDA